MTSSDKASPSKQSTTSTTTAKGAAAQLAALSAEFWAGICEAQPLFATSLGDRRFDDRIDDITPAGIDAQARRQANVAERARAIPEVELEPGDRVTRLALIEEATGGSAVLGLHLEEWTVDHADGWHSSLQSVATYQPIATPDQARAMVRRWQLFGPQLDQHIGNLRRGLADGRVAVRTPVTRVIDALTVAASVSDDESAFLAPLREAHDDWDGADVVAFSSGLTTALHDSIKPAMARYRAFLAEEVLPRARPDTMPGIGALPGGESAYRTLVRYHTTLEVTPEELHATGHREVARINSEIEMLGRDVLGVKDRAAALGHLRADPSMHFAARDEIAATARAALARANAAVPRWFGRLPIAPCEVVPMPAHEEEHAPIAYYRQPAADGTRPGQFYLNTSHPETRPRYEAECLAFHESVPGHHLQLAIAQELANLPDFRRHLGATAFWEGWGLYTERLSDEMGLYSGDIDRIGMLSMDAWRACRLVVDTGIHALGWTRQQAIDFMFDNSALAENNIANEVDRYIVWPGQALAYKAGQLEILRLRADAQDRLGQRFAIDEFHDAVLANGALALGTLRDVVDEWVGTRGG